MRVAFLVPSLGLQEGQGSVNLELLRRIAAAGHQVDVYTSNAPPSVSTITGVRLHPIARLPSWQLGNQLIMLGATTAKLRPSRFSVVHADAGMTLRRADLLMCHTVTDRWYSLDRAVWREPGLRGAHNAAATRFKAALELRQFRAARIVMANSQMTAEDLAARGVSRARIRVIPFGVDSERFRPPDPTERAQARASFGIAPGEFVAVMVGAHGPRKGLPQALDAIAGAPVRLLVAGEARGGRWKRDAEARRLPVLMPGKLADIRSAYWAADLLLYPSLYDAFGMAVLEAMACGLPVVVSRNAGAHEIVGEAGVVVDDLSPATLRAAMEAMRDDPDTRTRQSELGRKIALGRSWDKAASMLMDAYTELRKSP